MKLPNWLKIVWWLLLVCFFAYLLSERYDSIMSGVATATDIVILLILIALLAIPLFQEVSIFGVSFKKEIGSLRNDIEKQMISLKSEIQNIIYVYPPTPPSDSELKASEERIKPALEANLKQKGIEPSTIIEEDFVPEETKYLFSIRYALENELSRLYNPLWHPSEVVRPIPFIAKVQYLHEKEMIEPEIYNAIREVWVICNAAIHGQGVSIEAINFVREIAPRLIATLKKIKPVKGEYYGKLT